MARFIEGEDGSFDLAKLFELQHLKHAGEPPYNVRGNSERFFITSIAPNSIFTSVDRTFYIPFQGKFEPRTSVFIDLPNVDFNTPDKFAEGKIWGVSQKDEHGVLVELDSAIVCNVYTNISQTKYPIQVSTNYNQAVSRIFVKKWRHEGYNSPSLVVDNPLLKLWQQPVTLISETEPFMCRFSLSDDKKTITLLLSDGESHFKIIVPSIYSLQSIVKKSIEEGKLDYNLLYHALDGYGPWDESFNTIDWASEAGVEITQIEKKDWDTLMKGV